MAGPHTDLDPDVELKVTREEIAGARRAMRDRLQHEEGTPIEQLQAEVVTRTTTGSNPLAGWLYRLSGLLALAGLIVFTILGFRLGFMMGDVNPNAGFVSFINDISGPLVQPFKDAMRNRTLDSGGVFEPAAAIAMGVYLIATVLGILALWSLAPRSTPGRTSVVRRRRMIVHQQ